MKGFLQHAVYAVSSRLRWKLGRRVAAEQLEAGTDESVAAFYNGRVTDCSFLSDPKHYEYPRAAWLLARVCGPQLLEIGCGNGGMTRLLSPKAQRLTVLDISQPSLEEVRKLGLPNVELVCALVETFVPAQKFDCIVMSEVLEHLRAPEKIVALLTSWLAPGGSLLITTPHGHWESNEHLQEFTLKSFLSLLQSCPAETVEAGFLRDRDQQRRWLVACITAAQSSVDDAALFDSGATAHLRAERATAKTHSKDTDC